MIRFLVEMFRRTELDPGLAITAAVDPDQGGKFISKIDCSPHPTGPTYWTAWGGTYDNIETNTFSVFFNGYLDPVTTVADFLFAYQAILKGTDCLYISTDGLYPWQYPRWQTEISELEGYSTAVPDSTRPSNDKLGGVRYPVRLALPSIQIKLSDIISGTALQNATFQIGLENNDGFFDKTEDRNIFNVPLYLLKSDKAVPSYADYAMVRRGFVDDITVSFDSLQIKTATFFRSLTEPVCRIITDTEYPAAGDNLDKKIPCAWGEVEVEPIKVDTYQYLLCDPDYFTSVEEVRDGNGVVIDPADYTAAAGILTMDPAADDPGSVTIIGKTANRIGEIITTEMQEKSRILYTGASWNKTEADLYVTVSPRVDLLFDDGTVQDLVTACLRNDNAFLIERTDGTLSLRKWGETYATHNLEAWQITQPPEKSYLENKNFASSVRIIYPGGEYLDSSRENSLLETYRKKQERAFETILADPADAVTLAESLLDRLGGRPDTFRVAFGFDTSAISLLDTVNLDLLINGRRLTSNTAWIVKEIDVGQDVLLLESK